MELISKIVKTVASIEARGTPDTVVSDIPGGGLLRGGGHWTRDIAFSRDGKKMFIPVGSHSNDFENPNENEDRRADILEYNPDGTGFRIYASGIRNAVGIAINPQTGELWASTAGRGTISADTRIRVTPASIRNSEKRCSFLTSCFSRTRLHSR